MLEKDRKIAERKAFVLTRDMTPIDIGDGIMFACPLPRGYRAILGSFDVKEIGQEIANQINFEVQRVISPFENILLGYHERTVEQKKDLLQQFIITNVGADNRGVYSVQAGFDVNSGDIYLSSDEHSSLRPGLYALDYIFEPNVSWRCHNIDFYWQALLTRDFCVRYFNCLNEFIFGKRKYSRQEKLLTI